MKEIRVKVADYAVAGGDTTIVTIGLGSCVAIMLLDPEARVGGLAHVLLPSESLSRDTSNPAKFPSTAVPLMVDEMRRLGARGPISAKIVGGASMFRQLLPQGTNMGERNVDATRAALVAAGVPILAEDVGGEHGRSVYLDVRTGRVLVRSLKRGDIEL